MTDPPLARDVSGLPHALPRDGLARAVPTSTFGIPIPPEAVEQIAYMIRTTRLTGTRVLLQINDPARRGYAQCWQGTAWIPHASTAAYAAVAHLQLPARCFELQSA